MERAFDELFVVDASCKKPVMHKERVYELLSEWEMKNDPSQWKWTQLPIDPVRDIIEERLPPTYAE